MQIRKIIFPKNMKIPNQLRFLVDPAFLGKKEKQTNKKQTNKQRKNGSQSENYFSNSLVCSLRCSA